MNQSNEYITKIARLTIEKLGLHYQAFVLSEPSVKKLLSKFPPKFENVKAHHITHLYDSPSEVPKAPESIKVVGIAENESVQALVVEIDGSIKRPDGKIYHITLSLGKGAKANDSNDLLSKGFKKVSPVEIEVKPSIQTPSQAA